jgi:ATP-dependent exoDNAse (exonuclease V) alpha subunit
MGGAMKANSRTQAFLRDLRLPRAERAARRAERRAEDLMRRTRDNDQTPERRAAAVEAERRRHQHVSSGNTGPMGP